MRYLLAVGFVLAISDSWMLGFLEEFFYPGLLLIFIVASLGVPIPEDIPLILAGVLIKTDPEIARWQFALPVALVGIMSGDIILYSLGRRWGRNIFEHRSVSWLITPRRIAIMDERFNRWGAWACFFGRFMVGVRAIMCLTAGVTRFPFWKFVLADLSGAMLSVPFFMFLGYKFAEKLPDLYKDVKGAQAILFILLGLVGAGIVLYEVRRMRKVRREDAAAHVAAEARDAVAKSAAPADAASPEVGTAARRKPMHGNA